MFILNRAAVVNVNSAATRDMVEMSSRQAEIAQLAELAELENTRTAEEIANQRNQIATVSADNTRIAGIAIGQEKLATAESIATYAAATVTTIYLERATATNTPRVVFTPTPSPSATPNVPVWDRLKIIGEGRINLREGPGTEYQITALVEQGQEVDWLAQNELGDWYNVRTDDGVIGWVHTSLVVPVAMVDMPVAATVPATPFQFPTSLPTPTIVNESYP